MPNHIYFVPREGTTNTNTTIDDCLLVLNNRVNPLRDRAWSGEIEILIQPFTPGVKLDRNLSDKVYLGVEVIFVDDPIVIDTSNFVERT